MAGVPHLVGKSGDWVVVGGFVGKVAVTGFVGKVVGSGFGVLDGAGRPVTGVGKVTGKSPLGSEYVIWKLNDIGAEQNEHNLVFCILSQDTFFVVNLFPFVGPSLQKSNRLLLESIRTKLFRWQLIWLLISTEMAFNVIYMR